MLVVFNGLQLIVIAILVLWLIVYVLILLFQSFNAWRKTGFCKHEYKLDRTNSFGRKNWYKCEKCKDERLM